MERLTKRYDTHIAVICDNCDKQLECKYGGLSCGEVLRERLATYEDTGLMPEEIDSVFINSTIEENKRLKEEIASLHEPPNLPLNLEELREMNGEPVWVCNPKDIQQGHWAIVRNDLFDGPEYNHCAYAVGICWTFSDYGETWLAYRRKPEEGTT